MSGTFYMYLGNSKTLDPGVTVETTYDPTAVPDLSRSSPEVVCPISPAKLQPTRSFNVHFPGLGSRLRSPDSREEVVNSVLGDNAC